MKADSLFYFFVIFLVVSIAGIITGIVLIPVTFLSSYLKVYVIVLLSYLWYRFVLLFIQEIRSGKYNSVFYSPVSVIIPVYNEEKHIIKRTISSALSAFGEKEVIVVNDGSDAKHTAELEEVARVLGVNLISYHPNKGKRNAQAVGFKNTKFPLVITLDSDTVINHDGIRELIKPFSDKNVGAVTGQVLVRNEQKNFLTRMLFARYWSAFNIERKSLVSYEIVNCCTGAFSAYRREVVLDVLDLYANQVFLGNICTYGDDRHLTNLFLERGYRIVYQETAMAYTEVPETLKKLVRQQVRWKRSFIRESLYCLTFAWKRSKLLFFEVILNLLLPFFSLLPRLLAIPIFIIYPPFILLFGASLLLVAFIRNLPLVLTNWKKGMYSLYYVFVHELVLYWLFPWALFTLKEKSWVSR